MHVGSYTKAVFIRATHYTCKLTHRLDSVTNSDVVTSLGHEVVGWAIVEVWQYKFTV